MLQDTIVQPYLTSVDSIFSDNFRLLGKHQHLGRRRDNHPGDPEKGERSSLFTASSGYWLGPPLIRPSLLQPFVQPLLAPRASAPLRPAPGASQDGAAPNLLSTCHRPARGPFAARLKLELWSCVAKWFTGRFSSRSWISMHISKDHETAHS